MDDFLNGTETDDIRLIDLKTGTVQGGWEPEKLNYLVIFIPKVFTPVCKTELASLQEWVPHFEELGFEIMAGSVNHEEDVLSWYDTEPLLKGAEYRVICSRQLPEALGILRRDGSLKRSSVFFTVDYELVVQEHFNEVARSLPELHRQAWGWFNKDYCTEDWKNPID